MYTRGTGDFPWISYRPQCSSTVKVADWSFRAIPGGSIGPPGNDGHLCAARPGKDRDSEWVIWLCVTESSGDFTPSFAPYKTCYLREDIDACETGSAPGVIEVYSFVVSTSPRRKQRRLPWRKCNCFDRSGVHQTMSLTAVWNQNRSSTTGN